jgi:hypothetical protein
MGNQKISRLECVQAVIVLSSLVIIHHYDPLKKYPKLQSTVTAKHDEWIVSKITSVHLDSTQSCIRLMPPPLLYIRPLINLNNLK